MAIDSISLIAQNIYSQVQNRPKTAPDQDFESQAVSFQKMVQKDFNSFAKMSPEQILSRIQNAKTASGVPSNLNNNGSLSTTGIIGAAAKDLRESLNKQENLVRKSLINETSLIDILTATNEAADTMKTMSKIRDKFMEAFEKVMNMSM